LTRNYAEISKISSALVCVWSACVRGHVVDKTGRTYTEGTSTFLPSSLANNHPFALVHLYQPTCFGFKYVSFIDNRRSFSWNRALSASASNGLRCGAWTCIKAAVRICLHRVLTQQT